MKAYRFQENMYYSDFELIRETPKGWTSNYETFSKNKEGIILTSYGVKHLYLFGEDSDILELKKKAAKVFMEDAYTQLKELQVKIDSYKSIIEDKEDNLELDDDTITL